MRRASLLLVTMACIAAGCGPTETRNAVAVGARGELSSTLGPCAHASSSALRFVGGEHYEALAPGVVRLTCRDGITVLDVRVASRLAIDPVPTAAANARLVYAVRAYDAAGIELAIGGDASIGWVFGGALAARAYPGCGDVLPICLPRNDGFAVATGAGVGTIEATFAGLRARTTTTIAP